MATTEEAVTKPLWIGIEEKLAALDIGGLTGTAREDAIQKIVRELDKEGFKVSSDGGRMMQLRWAMDDMAKVGRPLLKDLNAAVFLRFARSGSVLIISHF